MESLVGTLNRGEAMSVLKEIISKCDGSLAFNVSSINLIPPNAKNTLSVGYQLHIKSYLCSEDRTIIQNIMDTRQLAFKDLGNRLVIYKPQK